MSKWLTAYFNEPGSEAQRKFIAGKLSFKSDEESITKLCEQIQAMGKLYREVGENYVRVDIIRNENHEKENKPEFSFNRNTWSKDGSLREKIDAAEAKRDQGSESEPAFTEDPIDDDDDLPF